jgi:hypothetical protein
MAGFFLHTGAGVPATERRDHGNALAKRTPMERWHFHYFLVSLLRYFIFKNKKRSDLSERFPIFQFPFSNF